VKRADSIRNGMAARPIDGDALYGCTSGPLDDFDDDRTAGPATSRDGDDYDAEFDGASKPTWRIAPPEVQCRVPLHVHPFLPL
jgi:hypothetical protein